MNIQAACPCCGKPAPSGKLPATSLLRGAFTPAEKAMLNALVYAYPAAMSCDQIIDVMYDDLGREPPKTARTLLSVYVHALNKKLSGYGWTIDNGDNKGGRGHLGQYRLSRSAMGRTLRKAR